MQANARAKSCAEESSLKGVYELGHNKKCGGTIMHVHIVIDNLGTHLQLRDGTLKPSPSATSHDIQSKMSHISAIAATFGKPNEHSPQMSWHYYRASPILLI
jgi:hypothetical protein